MKSTPRPPSCVSKLQGQLIATDKAKVDTICKWLEQRFTDLPMGFHLPHFDQPITTSEVESTMNLPCYKTIQETKLFLMKGI